MNLWLLSYESSPNKNKWHVEATTWIANKEIEFAHKCMDDDQVFLHNIILSRLKKPFPTHSPTFVSVSLKQPSHPRPQSQKWFNFITSNIEDLMICNVDVGWYEKGHIPKSTQL